MEKEKRNLQVTIELSEVTQDQSSKHDSANIIIELKDSSNNTIALVAKGKITPSRALAFTHLLKEAFFNMGLKGLIAINGFVDVIILEIVGDNTAIAAMTLISTLSQFLLYVIYNALNASGLLMTKKLAKGKLADVGKILRHTCLFSLLLSIPMIAGMLLSKKFLMSLGIDEEIADYVIHYFRITAGANPALLLMTSLHNFFLSLQNSEIVFGSGLLYILGNVLIGYPLALGLFGLPQLGFAGLAWGVFGSSYIATLATFGYLWRSPASQLHDVFNRHVGGFNGVMKGIAKIWRMGAFLGLQSVSESLSWLLVTLLMGILGEDALLAVEVPFTINLLMSSGLFAGLNQVMAVLIKNTVAVTMDNLPWAINLATYAWRLGSAGTGLSLGASCIVALLYATIPDQLASVLIDFSSLENSTDFNQTDFNALIRAMAWAGASDLLLSSLRLGSAARASGYNSVKFPAISSFLGTLVTFPVSVGLTLSANWSPTWVLNMRNIGMFGTTAANLYHLCQKDSELKKKIEQEQIEKAEETELLTLSREGYQTIGESTSSPIQALHFLSDSWSEPVNEADLNIETTEKNAIEGDIIDDICLPTDDMPRFCVLL